MSQGRRDRLVRVACGAAVAAAVLSMGCVRVEPHQRAVHSKRCMSADPDPAAKQMREHVHENREAALGGQGVTGGGCGCN